MYNSKNNNNKKPRINLIKEMKDLNKENQNTLMKEITDTKNGKRFCVPQLEELILPNYPHSPKQ